MSGFPISAWVAHLRAIAGPALPSTGDVGPTELHRLVHAVVGDAPAPPLSRPGQGAEGLWQARLDRTVEVDRLIDAGAEGPLLPRSLHATVEVWTTADLAAMHALSRLAVDRARPDWDVRVHSARDWHLEHTQPDNATNRPWALHVFRLADTPECVHYAETLLHNCLAIEGHPDALSALLLLDAAEALVA